MPTAKKPTAAKPKTAKAAKTPKSAAQPAKAAVKPAEKSATKPAVKPIENPTAKPAGKPASASAMPAVGEKAPAFKSVDADGKPVKLADYKGKIVALYFYPKDDTPGCTVEACSFRDSHALLRKAGIEVIGVSPDDAKSHRKFSDKFSLPFTLVADPDHAICEAYGVWQEKSNYGKTYMGVVRTTFVIDREGRIAQVFNKVKPEGHDQQVLDWVKSSMR